MRTLTLTACCTLAFALAMCGIAPPTSAATITVDFSPADQTTTVGNSVAVDLFASGFAPTVSVGSFDLFVAYDPGIVGAASVDFGPYLGDPTSGTALAGFDLSSTPGQAEVFEDSLLSAADLTALQDPVRSAGFTLATLTFIAGAPGTSPLTFPLTIAADANGAALDVTGGIGSITVIAPIPEPAGFQLTALALLATILLRRRARI